MANPVLVEVIRGSLVETRHRGAIAVSDAEGKTVFAIGDVASAIFPRSAVKALQALPLIMEGAAECFGLSDEELVLACASHSGEAAHVAGVARMLAKAGLDPSVLRCGAHWPVAHPVQHRVRRVLEDFTGATLGEAQCAIDGCSVPTWAVPLDSLAYGFAKFGTGRGIPTQHAKAAARLRQSCAKAPWFVAGTGRFCTDIMQLFGERVFVKTGAEGVYCAALPGEGLGIAVKCDDGAGRAAQAIMAVLIVRFLPLAASEHAALHRFVQPVLRNWNNFEVGQIRLTEVLR